MSTDNHTAIPSSPKQAANAATFNGPLGTLDAAIGNLSTLTTTAKTSAVAALNEVDANADAVAASVAGLAGGASATAQTLKDWTEGGAYELTAITVDSDEVITTATVKWPDGSAGTFTTTTKNSTWLAVDAYTVSHTGSGQTVTQSAVTRNAQGSVTVKPALTVA